MAYISVKAFLLNAVIFLHFMCFYGNGVHSNSTIATISDPSITVKRFAILNDTFWRDDKPFQIIGGDLHYFRVHPQYWEDRLLKMKALGLNTIQTYIPWNLHEPRPNEFIYEGIADIISFLKLCHKMGFVVMLRAGPYICAEWDFGGFPPWLLAVRPKIRLRSSDPSFLRLVKRWWSNLFEKTAPLLYEKGGPVIMVQIENEYGSYGSDKAYLRHLVSFSRSKLGDHVILYTTDGGSRETLEKGTLRGDTVFSAVDFAIEDDPWPIFELQKQYNAPGKSPALITEFYTGWLTHWGDKIARTDAAITASSLNRILSRNCSAVLYMAHGGTNFGFYSGANTGAKDYDYHPDITSYDYDAPISEDGDVDNPKFKELHKVIRLYSKTSFPHILSKTRKAKYGAVKLRKTSSLFDMLNSTDVIESKQPLSMETIGQLSGFVFYTSSFVTSSIYSTLFIPKVHDRALVFITCPENRGRPIYSGTIERWSNRKLHIPHCICASNISLYILVENMGHVNYGQHLFDEKGILSLVYVDGKILNGWKMIRIPSTISPGHKSNHTTSIVDTKYSESCPPHNRKNIIEDPLDMLSFYSGNFIIQKNVEIEDTYLSLAGWDKGVVFINEFNVGRYWTSRGPQCNVYVPAPILRHGTNIVVILELEWPNNGLMVHLVDGPDFTCGGDYSGSKNINSNQTN